MSRAASHAGVLEQDRGQPPSPRFREASAEATVSAREFLAEGRENRSTRDRLRRAEDPGHAGAGCTAVSPAADGNTSRSRRRVIVSLPRGREAREAVRCAERTQRLELALPLLSPRSGVKRCESRER